jgi:methylmalonyl-CoA/ethylmalonyl-CoA epimerase
LNANPRLHHVVFCMRRANQDRAADFWRDLGFDFAEVDLPDVGLRVLLDWRGGIEIVAPTDAGPENADVRVFLDSHGEGVYSVVVRTDELEGPLEVAKRYGASVELRQHRTGDGYELDEAMLAPLLGMPVTFLVTDLPD